VTLLLAFALAAADPTLAPIEAMARTPVATQLLVFARDCMSRHWDGSTTPDTLAVPPWPGAPTGCFVSLVDGRTTRACVGSATPVRGSLRETVRSLATEVLTADRRHPPVRREELLTLRIVIAFAGVREAVADPMQVDPGREGLLIASPRGSIAFLPGEARTVSWALSQARQLGVLQSGSKDAGYERFEVTTIAEPTAPLPRKEAGDAAP